MRRSVGILRRFAPQDGRRRSRRSLLQLLEQELHRFFGVHQRELLERLAAQRAVLLAARHLDQRLGVALDEEGLDDLLLDPGVGGGAVDLLQALGRLGAAAHSQALDRLATHLRVGVGAGHFAQGLDVPGDEQAFDDLALDLGRALGAVELAQLSGGAHRAQQLDRLAAQPGVLLALGGGQQAGLVVGDQEALQDLAAQARVGDRGIHLGEQARALLIAGDAEQLDRLFPHLGVLLAACHLGDDLAGARRIALREDEEGLLGELLRLGLAQELPEHRPRPLRVVGHQALQGVELELFVPLAAGGPAALRRARGPAAADLDLERLGVVEPGALGVFLLELLQGFERRRLAPVPVLGGGLPVKSGSGLRAALGGEARAQPRRLGPAASVQGFLAGAVIGIAARGAGGVKGAILHQLERRPGGEAHQQRNGAQQGQGSLQHGGSPWVASHASSFELAAAAAERWSLRKRASTTRTLNRTSLAARRWPSCAGSAAAVTGAWAASARNGSSSASTGTSHPSPASLAAWR